MKIPLTPPPLPELINSVISRDGGQRYPKILLSNLGPAPGGQYRHWDTFRHLKPADDLSHEESWLAVKLARQQLYQALPLRDVRGQPFQYALPGVALKMLNQIDKDACGNISVSEQVTNPQTRNTYLVKSLIEESITSSQLEGAATTRRVAKSMIQEGRKPRTRSEMMIYNNYQAMLFIRRFLDQPLTTEIILELQRILTDGTLDSADAAGRFRRDDELIQVTDELGQLLHDPPAAAELEQRMQDMCSFANEMNSPEFVHPGVRAVVLHLWLAYDHPFVDGNGRTARALFYWSMAAQGYWLCEYISISRILRAARAQYARAFLYTETDDNDATYFILYQLRVIIRAIQELHRYLAMKAAQIRETEELIKGSKELRDKLNHRQLALINHALKDPDTRYTVESHRRLHDISYETSRTDLLDLAKLGLLEKRKLGRAFSFTSPADLRGRLTRWSARRRVG